MLQRLRSLTGPIRDFAAFVRTNEKILSKASITNVRANENAHNIAQHQLAQARQSFQCSCERQSRHQQWFSFAERAVKDVQDHLEQEGVPGKTAAACVPSHIGPSTTIDDAGRKFQLFVVRPCCAGSASGGLRFALPGSIWRAGRLRKKPAKNGNVNSSGQRLLASGKLPVHLITSMHVQLLMPFQNSGTEDSQKITFIGTFPVFLVFFLKSCWFCFLFFGELFLEVELSCFLFEALVSSGAPGCQRWHDRLRGSGQ